MEIRFKKCSPHAVMPHHGSQDAAGYDLTATSVRRVGSLYIYQTDIAVEIPHQFCGIVYPRSSVYLTGLTLLNSVGVIDADFRGSISAVFRETPRTKKDMEALRAYLEETHQENKLPCMRPYEPGERIAQLVIQPCVSAWWTEAQTMTNTQRGAHSYGSTGR